MIYSFVRNKILKPILQRALCIAIDNDYSQAKRLHPLVWVSGTPKIGKNVYIGGFSEVYAKGAEVVIGDECDIASFVVINAADSWRHCIAKGEIERLPITIGNNVYIGTGAIILGGTTIGHHSVIGANVVLKKVTVPPYSMVKRKNGIQIVEVLRKDKM